MLSKHDNSGQEFKELQLHKFVPSKLFRVVIFSYDLNWTFWADFDSVAHLIKQTSYNNHFEAELETK